jgi:hypothetical protein
MAIRIGPARVKGYLPGEGGVDVLHDDKVIKTFGNDRDAGQFAMGYNYGWWAAQETKEPAK